MKKGFPASMSRLMEKLGKMPGIGARSAQRITFYLLKAPRTEVEELLLSIKKVKETIRFCRKCNNLSDKDICHICSDESRQKERLCVVESPAGIIAMEKSGAYNGFYHVLLGSISPLDGIGPEDLKISQLVKRIKDEGVKEVVIATDFTTEGETTALYLAEILKPYKVKVTRLARGVPMGATLEYADVATLNQAFEDRKHM